MLVHPLQVHVIAAASRPMTAFILFLCYSFCTVLLNTLLCCVCPLSVLLTSFHSFVIPSFRIFDHNVLQYVHRRHA